MAEPKENVLMEKIVSLCKRRGFIYQSSEIYGGINGFWDYGPLGAELKRNVKETWWNAMTRQRDDVVGLDATIIMNPAIWRASGHVDTFSDPMCDCLLTGKRFRADQIETQSGIVYSYSGAVELRSMLFLAAGLASENFGGIPKPNDSQHANAILQSDAASVCLREACTEESLKEAVDFCKDLQTSGLQNGLNKYLSLRDTKGFSWAGPSYETYWSLAEKAVLRGKYLYSVILPSGKPPESARKIATQFYSLRREINHPVLIGEAALKEENSTRFNPENGSLLTDPKPFNLMFHTFVGASEPAEKAYLRPETAQAIFAQFKNVLETSRQKVPFGIAQIGKAFRNEVTPRNFTFRSREFEQMELEFFIKPDEAIEAIHGKVGQYPVTSNQSASKQSAADPLPTADCPLPTPQPDWGWQAWHQYWVEERVRYYESIGLSRATLGYHIQTADELAHYARATTDILYKFPFSKADAHGDVKGDELEGIAARSDFDLSQHQRFSGKPMGVFDEELKVAWAKLDPAKQAELSERYYQSRFKYLTKTGEAAEKAEKQANEDADGLAKGQYIPHVIEPSAGADRLILALISDAFHEEETVDEKGKKETITKLKFHPRVAPIKVGVYPLLKNKPDLVAKAKEVRDLLRPHLNVFYDESGSIGRRYARADEIGTPFGITIDFDTLGEKGPELKDTVTLRHRDDGRQERIQISELLGWLLERVR
jgi:glycyl-tRNA synthetase